MVERDSGLTLKHLIKLQKYAKALLVIDNILALLWWTKYFSKLDLKSGYWQVRLHEKDKEKSEFVSIQCDAIWARKCTRCLPEMDVIYVTGPVY